MGPVIEDGFYYDFGNVQIQEEDLERIEEGMREIIREGLPFLKEMWPADRAMEHFRSLQQPFKSELVADLAADGEAEVGMVSTGGIFLDLCRGGHVNTTKDLPINGFRLLSIAGAYWKGSADNVMLTRVYGAAFENKDALDEYLVRREEAKRRDHRKLGRELDLFVFSDLVGPGLPLYTPRGAGILGRIRDFSRSLRRELGYEEVHTPQINKGDLFRASGHYEKYREDMFLVRSNYTEEEYFLKPMNCPQHTQLYASQIRSYRDLPVRYADFANLYRDEKPGELSGLTRLRAFSQDDGHCFCREDQIKEEFSSVLSAISEAMNAYGMDYWIRLSLRDEDQKENYLGDDSVWEKSQATLREILQEHGVAYREAPGEAAFYGPKMDLIARDSLGREWQLSTIQIDFTMPQRFGLEYIDRDGGRKTPVMIHSALIGSAERFLAVLIEHFAGAFPLWLAPEQARILPVSDKLAEYARSAQARLQRALLRVRMDESGESLGRKIREGERAKVPYLLIAGEREAREGTLSVRGRGGKDLGTLSMDEISERMEREISARSAS